MRIPLNFTSFLAPKNATAVLGFSLALALLGGTASATTYTWTGGDNTTPATWDTTNTNWNTTTTPLWDATNGPSNVADFNTAGGNAASVGAAITANGIIFDTATAVSAAAAGDTITLAGTTPTITSNVTGNTISAILAGTTGVTFAGTGSVTLSGLNTYTGGTAISAGTVLVGVGNNGNTSGGLGAGANALSITSGAFLNLNGNSVYIGALSGSGTVENNVAGATNTLNLGYNSTATTTFSGVIEDGSTSGKTYINKQSSGTQILTGTNTYTGNTTVTAGTLQIGNGTTGSISSNSKIAISSTTTLAFDEANGSTISNAVTNASGTLEGNEGSNITNTFGGAITNASGTLAFTQAGAGTTILTGNNSLTGTITVTGGGTLKLAPATTGNVTLGGTTAILVNGTGGGTLQIGGNNQIKAGATVSLGSFVANQVTFNTGGYSQTTSSALGALTLTKSSIIDFSTLASGNTNSVLAFGNSSSATWTASQILSVYDYSGSASGGGTDQLYFGTSNTGLTATQLGDIKFYSDGGTTLLGGATILSDGEVVPAVPEPATVFAGLLMVATLGWKQRRRLGAWLVIAQAGLEREIA